MPVYEYQCQKCGYEFELVQGFDAPTEGRCPECEGKARRIMPRFSFTISDGKPSRVNPNARRVRV